MKLDLREYTDPEHINFHARCYIEKWRFTQYFDRKDEVVGSEHMMEEAEMHREWLVRNASWLVPHLDREIIRFLT